ncbi:tail fiber protein [Pseudomonas sp. 51_B]|uniref:tail fiber protein n=1 Tax=Pseudomonas sp. 51_B TaxID=2813573 RepID=UPI00325FAF14
MAFGRTGVTAGTYRSVQVDKYGRVVAATNPTTVAGYGITDVYTKSETYTKAEANQAIKTAVDAAVNGLVASAPGALDTLDELAAALGDDANFSVTMLNKLAEKAPLASPKFTGSPEVPTPTAGSTGLQAANMAALVAALSAASRSFKAAAIGVSTSLTLTAAQAGNAVQFNNGPLTLTLPAVADTGNGASFMLRNPSTTATQTLNVASSGSIVEAGSTVASTLIKPSEWLEVAASSSSWFVVGRGKLKEVAEIDSPVFTGNPRVPTTATDDNSKSAANTEFVKALLKLYGLGERYAGVIIDIDDPTLGNGWYAVTLATTAGVKPAGQTWGTVFVAGRSNTPGTNGRVMQTFLATDSAVARQMFRTYFNGGWTAWEETSTLTALQSALAAVGIGVTGVPPALADMDSATTPTGFYRVSSPTGSLPAGVSRYGTVLVERYAAANIRQTFSPVGGGEGREFSRTLGSAGAWLPWEESAKLASPAFSGDVGVPTRATADRSANAASTQFVANLLGSLGWGTSDLADLASGVDLNTLNAGGSYQVNSALNGPSGFPTGVLFVVGTNAQNYTHQLFFPQGVNRMFHRCSSGATSGVVNWSAWEEVPDLTTVNALIAAAGWGVTRLDAIATVDDVTLKNGIYAVGTTTLGVKPANQTYGVLEVKGRTNSATSTRVTQVFHVTEGLVARAFERTAYNNEWGVWRESAFTDSPTFTGEVVVKGGNVLRYINQAETYGLISRVDNTSYYLLVTDSGSPTGSYNALRPLQLDFATGQLRFNHGATVAAPADDDNSTRVVNSAWVKKKVDMAAPAGQVAHFALSTPPAGWLKRNGAAVSRTAYAALFAVIGTTFGAGDGSTTFNVPDDRELIDRSWTDGLNSADAGRALFSTQAGQLESHIHTGTALSGGAHTHTVPNKREYVDSVTTASVNAVYGDEIREGTDTTTTSSSGTHSHTLSINATGGNETRMANRAYLACIKY